MPLRNLTLNERNKLINNVQIDKFKTKDAEVKFKVSRWTVSRCLNNSQEIDEAVQNGLGKRKRFERRPEVLDHDERVKKWILSCQDKGLPLSATLIIEYAKEEAENMDRDDLKCSWSWFSRFKERINLKLGRTNGEKKSVNLKIVEYWKTNVIPRIMIDWQSEFIYNCDETALFWRQIPVKTYFISKLDHSGTKIFHERISILFCVNRNGDKLPPLVINKAKKPQCFYANCLDNLFIQFSHQTNAWMNKELFVEWLTTFHNSLAVEGKKILLILDNFRGHRIVESDFPLITFKFLPSGTTSLTQPLDAGIIRSFKSKYLSLFVRKIISEINSTKHITEIVGAFNLLDALNWLDTAWKSVSSETIVNCWTHFGYKVDSQPIYDDDDGTNNLSHLLNNLTIETQPKHICWCVVNILDGFTVGYTFIRFFK
ncbi:tigger transposable element-derived protein 4-like [Tetranychus urticae]|uniref:tigger transposable element-derived protein 4-like n=1 Tax=Tetranychus urticae TaxID=32264 RepID=UPI000D65617A|nr:tigger transposable element-derived protein 4-like [Tetranychus urticae]